MTAPQDSGCGGHILSQFCGWNWTQGEPVRIKLGWAHCRAEWMPQEGRKSDTGTHPLPSTDSAGGDPAQLWLKIFPCWVRPRSPVKSNHGCFLAINLMVSVTGKHSIDSTASLAGTFTLAGRFCRARETPSSN